ncbi:lipid A biosynthesis acyltransferase [Sulfurivirga caldicuralii]|uniref:Lipid A biosynthesis acyltransferase n=1 Tax=Sulfurivirga caldicuralii TaxID=364032 RepID=A0A1N6H5H2_9GAMM|nr:hypothetical protein [Sulfurivirga caldicuralii]SIO15003.1 lipid A biosynthesis acyltransferase [Sulfurivirga caldicuralii]
MSMLSNLCHRHEAFLRAKTCTPQAFDADYERLVPWLSSLPQPLCDQLSRLRARFNACLQRDVLDYIIQSPPTAAQRVVQAAQYLAPRVQRSEQALIYGYRYHKSLLDVLDLRVQRLQRFRVEWVGQAPEPDPRPRLWVGMHWSMSIPGFALIAARRGRRVNAIATAATIDPVVPQGFRRHLARRYHVLEKSFHGGRVLFKEQSMIEIARAFSRGEDMVVLFDLPAPKASQAVYLPFFGEMRAFSGGALKMARRYGYRIHPYWVDYLGRDRVRIWCGEAVAADDEAGVAAALRAPIEQIERQPEKWFVFEQLPFFAVRP